MLKMLMLLVDWCFRFKTYMRSDRRQCVRSPGRLLLPHSRTGNESFLGFTFFRACNGSISQPVVVLGFHVLRHLDEVDEQIRVNGKAGATQQGQKGTKRNKSALTFMRGSRGTDMENFGDNFNRNLT